MSINHIIATALRTDSTFPLAIATENSQRLKDRIAAMKEQILLARKTFIRKEWFNMSDTEQKHNKNVSASLDKLASRIEVVTRIELIRRREERHSSASPTCLELRAHFA